jgi:ABC-type bacteriocin/lantibiotic exporter with double-glycine peptidase domain
MPWLNIPHIQQAKTGWCLPACVAMATAYLQQPLLQDDIARWLGTDELAGTPSSRVTRLTRQGFEVIYTDFGTLLDLKIWLNRQLPPILFILTGELSYWKIDTPHAVVLGGFTGNNAHLFDPAVEAAPQVVSIDELLLAWSYFDYTYAALEVA